MTALPTESAPQFGAGEQFAHFRFASCRHQSQAVERTGGGFAFDRYVPAGAVPAEDLQPRIVLGMHKAEALAQRFV